MAKTGEAATYSAAQLPRSETMDGTDLRLAARPQSADAVRITDGERTWTYVPFKRALKDKSTNIVPGYVEAGWYSEARSVTLTDGRDEAVYVPRGKETREPG